MSNKAETARVNGAKSNGPVTEEGKSISSQNSLKHGLTSARVVLPHESQEEYDSLEASIVNRFKPYDEIERVLVREMASALWRLQPPTPKSPNRRDSACYRVTRRSFAAHTRKLGRKSKLFRNSDYTTLHKKPKAAYKTNPASGSLLV
jgi:hypothetical protein